MRYNHVTYIQIQNAVFLYGKVCHLKALNFQGSAGIQDAFVLLVVKNKKISNLYL